MPGPMQLNHEHPDSVSTGGGGIPEAPTDSKQYGRQNSAWTEILTGGGGGGLFDALVILKDVKSAGTSGGTGTADTWTARVLNTEEEDTASICTLSSNQFTLPAGTYFLCGTQPLFKTRSYKTRIYNVTDSTETVIGNVGIADDGQDMMAHPMIMGVFTIAASKTFEYQYRADQNSGGNSALGNAFASDTGTDNVFAQLFILRLA